MAVAANMIRKTTMEAEELQMAMTLGEISSRRGLTVVPEPKSAPPSPYPQISKPRSSVGSSFPGYLPGNKLLYSYVAPVRAEKLIVENDDVAAGLLDLIVQHQVTTLILSSMIDRQEHDNVYAVETYDLPSFGSSQCLSGSSNNTVSILQGIMFSVVFDHESLNTFKGETASHLNVVGQSQEFHQAFHAKCVEMGIESVFRLDCKNFQKKQWMPIYRWHRVLLFTIRVLEAILTESKQNHISEAVKEPIRLLLNLASKVAKVKKSPEKLFCILNMHGALFDATPILIRVFDAEFVKIEVGGVVAALNESARGMLLELKILVQTYRPQHELTQGSVLTITEFLVKYIKLLVNHTGNLDPILCQGQADDLLNIEGVNLTGRLVSGIIADLESVVQESSSYVAEGLKFLFLVNNTDFVLRQVEESDVRLMVGAQWIKKRHNNIKQYMRDYLSSSWKQVVRPLETATTSSQKRLKNSFLKIFYPTPSPLRSFESALNKACKSQMHWKVCSPVRRVELRTNVIEYVVQAYQAYRDSLEESVRGDLEDLEPNLKSDLFEG
ncbi:exocyst complex component EXO70B1-like [Panicum hallii]|uniref:exocyst complex component EXO70B1-like n=1 Tax=Panicum hallii TaxID=206008 RepID=UPI000DF4D046|nr:exocyst complex component EXO70B1-like [Panicum hallii]